MRVIKFRAWQTVTKTMFYNIEKGMGAPNGNPPFADYLENEHMIVMQFTGLKDETGREVYEGDIVECPAIGILQGAVTWMDSGLFYCVVHANAVHGMYNGWTVTGNIYDNPELIKE